MLEGVLHIILMNGVLQGNAVSGSQRSSSALFVWPLQEPRLSQGALVESQGFQGDSLLVQACCSQSNLIFLLSLSLSEYLKAKLFVNSPHQMAVTWAWLINTQTVKVRQEPRFVIVRRLYCCGEEH